jgi:NAD(P)-dependent dehydrogenase (short-subunit alcohol dehydrogenase family)
MDLQPMDKVVIITGGAKGIGAAITRASIREGAIPVIIDRYSRKIRGFRQRMRPPQWSSF